MKNLSILFLVSSFFLFSCSSTGVFFVPGEKQVIESNLTQEYFSIAEAYKQQENYNKAIVYYKKVLSNKELYDTAFYEIAMCNIRLKKWNEARLAFIKYLRKDPDNMSLKSSLAYIEAMNGNLKKAEKMYSSICNDYPTEIEPLKNYINVLIAEEKLFLAAANVDILEDKFPDDESISIFRTKIKELLDDRKKDGDSSGEEEKTEAADGEKLFGEDEELPDDSELLKGNEEGTDEETDKTKESKSDETK